MNAVKEKKAFTYADYKSWPEGKRIEVIDGNPVMQSAPGVRHQQVLKRLLRKIDEFLDDKPCEVYPAPLELRLSPLNDESDTNVYEPDLMVICDKSKLTDRGVAGPPDMVVEILSPSTARYDKINKLNNYLKAGVREYWIVDPAEGTVAAHFLKDGEYTVRYYDEYTGAPVRILEGLNINLKDIFTE